jgi:hypothetical protein
MTNGTVFMGRVLYLDGVAVVDDVYLGALYWKIVIQMITFLTNLIYVAQSIL